MIPFRTFLTAILLSVLVQKVSSIRNYSLAGSDRSDFYALQKRLRSDSGNRNVVTCIGARDWSHRNLLKRKFNLDYNLTSSLSSPLLEKYDVWEDGHRLIVDVDCPWPMSGVEKGIDIGKLLGLCKASEIVVVFLSPRDVKIGKSGLELEKEAAKFISQLESGMRVYLLVPEAAQILHKVSKEERKLYREFVEGVKKRFSAKGIVVKSINEAGDMSGKSDGVKCSDLLALIHPPSAQTNLILAHLADLCFQPSKKLLASHLTTLYNNCIVDNFGVEAHLAFFDSALSYYIRTFHLGLNPNRLALIARKRIDHTFNINEAYTKLLSLSEAASMAHLRKLVGKGEPHRAVEEALRRFDEQVARLRPVGVSGWHQVVREVRKNLLDKLKGTASVHSRLPSTGSHYRAEEEAVDRQEAGKQRGLSFVLSLVAMIRDGGYGNRQAFFNYTYGPLIFTMGYANDRDVAEMKPGTGLKTPAFRFQPKLHLNLQL